MFTKCVDAKGIEVGGRNVAKCIFHSWNLSVYWYKNKLWVVGLVSPWKTFVLPLYTTIILKSEEDFFMLCPTLGLQSHFWILNKLNIVCVRNHDTVDIFELVLFCLHSFVSTFGYWPHWFHAVTSWICSLAFQFCGVSFPCHQILTCWASWVKYWCFRLMPCLTCNASALDNLGPRLTCCSHLLLWLSMVYFYLYFEAGCAHFFPDYTPSWSLWWPVGTCIINQLSSFCFFYLEFYVYISSKQMYRRPCIIL